MLALYNALRDLQTPFSQGRYKPRGFRSFSETGFFVTFDRWFAVLGALLPPRYRDRQRLSGHDVKQLAIGVTALAVAALLVLGLERASAQTRPAAPRGANWPATVAETAEGSHLIGNPTARRKLTAFVSYTCPHCAEFEEQAGGALLIGYVADGSTSLEIRHFVRDGIDLTAAMLAQCGTPRQFPLNHAAFMRSQSRWMAAAGRASQAQQQRWTSGEPVVRMRAIATDLGFYAVMQTRGFTRRQTDACLADAAVRDRLVAMTTKAQREQNVHATPSFMLGGILLAGTHDWALLEPQLRAR